MRIAVVGGGLLGLGVGYYLARDGHEVHILEAGDRLGGLATDVEIDGVQVDRFYHCILNSDAHLISLINEVGLGAMLRMRPVKAGFYHQGMIHPISTPLDILRFPPLRPIERLRLVRALLACRSVKDWHQLETIDVETWLRGLSGDRVFDTVWRPLLNAKFDGNFAKTPATYIWSRTVRMTDTRTSGGRKELAGHLVGGYRSLAERLAERIRAAGGIVRTSCPVEALTTLDGAVESVTAGGDTIPADIVVLTTPLPLTARLLHNRVARGVERPETTDAINSYADQVEAVKGYLGVICVLLVLKRPLSPYYTLYLADEQLPFTAVIESTNVIDPALVGGRHLVYLPKYVDPCGDLFRAPDDEIHAWFLRELRLIYPDLRDDDIRAAAVFRAPFVEPLHPLGSLGTIPPTQTPIDGVFIGSTKHLYPRLNNGDAVMRLAEEIARGSLQSAAARAQALTG